MLIHVIHGKHTICGELRPSEKKQPENRGVFIDTNSKAVSKRFDFVIRFVTRLVKKRPDFPVVFDPTGLTKSLELLVNTNNKNKNNNNQIA